ncbi:MAG: hypothetical protein EB087_04870 [Flavobacteriales bacterium]|nr:hypothetical protein [Flavobacteriales bacterium]
MVEFEHLSDKAKQDLVLVEEAKKGKQAAYAELMDRYRDSIYFTMLKMVKNTDDADDLTYFEEMSYEEIAEEMNLPLGTVKAQLFRARDFLASMIDKTKETI